jgi:hypothetical protein
MLETIALTSFIYPTIKKDPLPSNRCHAEKMDGESLWKKGLNQKSNEAKMATM